MSRPTWRVYEVRSKSWSSEPNTISTCSTVAPVAGRAGCRPGSGRAARRAGRAPSGARRPRRSAASRCWKHDLARAELLDARERRGRCPRPSWTSSVPVNSAWPSASPPPAGASSSTTEADAPSPSSMMVRVSSARPGAPAVQRSTIGRSRRTPAGTRSARPWFQPARVSCASASSAGSDARVRDEPPGASPGRARSARRGSRA